MPPADVPTTAPLSRAEIRRIVYGLMMAMLLGALDQTIVATALPTIGRDLGDVIHLPWVVTAYLLTATGAVPIYGRLADTYGRRPALLAAIGIFVAGSLGCALAPTMAVLIAARLVQGLGGGGLLALAQTIVGDMMTPRERGTWQVYFAAAFTVASLAGPVLGGFFAQHLSWTMIFWINLPLGIAAYAMTSRPLRRLPRNERRGKLDVAGAALLVGGTTTLLLTLSGTGVCFGWLAWPTLATFALAVALFVGFARHVARTPDPLIPLDVATNPVVVVATCAATPAVKADIDASLALGEDIGVNQTPMLSVNGRLLPLTGIPYETLRQIVAFQAALDGIHTDVKPANLNIH